MPLWQPCVPGPVPGQALLLARLHAGLVFIAFSSTLQMLSHSRLPTESSLFVPAFTVSKASLCLSPVIENQSFLRLVFPYLLSPSSLLSFHSMFLSWHFLSFPQVCLLLASYKKLLQETAISFFCFSTLPDTHSGYTSHAFDLWHLQDQSEHETLCRGQNPSANLSHPSVQSL